MDFQFKTNCYELSLSMDAGCDCNTPSSPEAYDPRNAENPFDEAGVVHNKILAVLATRQSEFMSDLPKAVDIAFDYIQSNPFQTKAMASGKLTREFREQVHSLIWPGGCFPEIWPPIRLPWPFPFPIPGNDWLTDLMWYIIRKGYSYEFMKGATLSDYKAEIVKAEQEIQARTMDKNQQATALCALSVLRHSIAYWNDKGQGNVQARQNPIITALADVSGSLIGFGLSLGNPLGAVVGSAAISGMVEGVQDRKN